MGVITHHDNTGIASLRIGILNRETERSFLDERKLIAVLESVVNNLKVKLRITPIVSLVHFVKQTIKEHATWMHTQDLIISPHGAGLTNAVFIRPCTAVLELFPKHYFIPGYYQTLIAAVHGVPFLAYPGIHPDDELSSNVEHNARKIARSHNFNFSTATLKAFFQTALPQMIERRAYCLKNDSNIIF